MKNDAATNSHKNSTYTDAEFSQTGMPHCQQLKTNKQTSFYEDFP